MTGSGMRASLLVGPGAGGAGTSEWMIPGDRKKFRAQRLA
jgi:hypothetical protein